MTSINSNKTIGGLMALNQDVLILRLCVAGMCGQSRVCLSLISLTL